MHVIPANRKTAARYLVSIPVFLLLNALQAYGATQPCSPTDNSLPCRLTGVLNWLEAAAVILAIILLVVIGVAVHLIRKNQISRRDRR